MAKPKRKWPKITAMVLAATVLTGSLALVLVEKFAPNQTYIPQSIVELPSKVIAAVMSPMQSAFAWATDGVSGYLESWKLRKTIEIEYNKLKAQNDDLVYQALYNQELEDKIARLEAQLGVFESHMEQNPILASVTGKETGNWFQMFTIDKGARHDIKANMAVINADGLIGYIYKVYETSSEVISIIDSRAGISGIIQSTRDQGVVRGTLGLGDEATCRMYYLPVDLVPRPGDTVVTSGIGLPFPKGLKIGVVRESTRYMDENKHYVVIEPEVDFQHIEEVIVLVYEPAEEDMPDSHDGQIDYVPSVLDTPRPVPPIGEGIDDPNLGAITPPPRATRAPVEGMLLDERDQVDPDATPEFTLAPGATPTPNPELDALMQQELDEEDF